MLAVTPKQKAVSAAEAGMASEDIPWQRYFESLLLYKEALVQVRLIQQVARPPEN